MLEHFVYFSLAKKRHQYTIWLCLYCISGYENRDNLTKETQPENKERKLILQNLEKNPLGIKIHMDSIREENAKIKSLCN